MAAPQQADQRRVALVSGAGRSGGLGAAIVASLDRAGYVVAGTDLTDTRAADESRREALFVPADLTDDAECARLVDIVVAQYGRLDVLVNNAAARAGDDKADIADVPIAAWDRVLAVNLRSAFLLTRLAVPVMRARRWGRIVNVSSLVGLVGRPQRAAYAASKAALLALTRSVALDVARDGITVNGVCPGLVRTERTMLAVRDAVATGRADSVESALAALAASVPMGRLAEPGEIADLIAFLASDEAGFVTGEAIGIHGGELFAGSPLANTDSMRAKEPEHV